MRAVVVSKDADADLTEVEAPAVGDGVLVDVLWSSLNFKDGLALSGNPGVARISPLVPGIDVVGRVVDGGGSSWAVGDEVVLTGAGLGETRWGGYAERAVLPADVLVRVPEVFGARRAAAIGTAGFTAAQAVLALERHAASSFSPSDGPVLVTGASGGLGSIAVALLAASGREVVAVTGRPAEAERLRSLGASDILDRAELAEPGKPLQKQRWAGAIDSVGGAPLQNVIAQLKYGCAVASCGLAASAELATAVHPFVLRGVALLGINSVEAPLAEREAVWERLARDLDLALLDASTSEIDLDGVIDAGRRILDGQVAGRTVVRVGRLTAMGLGMLIAGGIVAALAAVVHVAIFLMEAIGWRHPRVWRRFGLRSQEEADTVAPMAFNQGFYNLFLAIGVAVGLVLLATPVAQGGFAIVVLCVASMLAASVVLVLSRRALWRSALTQGLLPLVAVVLLVLAVV